MKKTALFLRLAVCICICLMFAACGKDSSTFSSKPSAPLDNPKLSVESFFKALRRGDYSRCNEYSYNYTFEIGESDEVQSGSDIDRLAQFLSDELARSYSVEFVSDDVVSIADGQAAGIDYSVVGQSAKVKYCLTILDLDKLKKDMHEEMLKVRDAQAKTGKEIDDAFLKSVINETVAKYTEVDITEYYKRIDMESELIYSDGTWKIIFNEELYNTLIGRG